MGLQRRSRFGFPPPTPPESQYTVRQVPLSTGPNTSLPWPLLPPGSATSMVNWLPLNGRLAPRSRLSSMNTIRSLGGLKGMQPRYQVSGSISDIWLSDATRHGVINSTGSISVASFTSAFGLGVSGLPTSTLQWQYTQVYYPGDADGIVLVAAPGPGSHNTLTITYFAGSNFRTSYLTSAPKAACVGSFDNYVVAWNTSEGDTFPTRAKWCQRGNPSNWTGEGSGFEDLLEMRGIGNRAMGTQDNRLILFSSHEIWYALPATYPAQFQFYPLDRSSGLLGPWSAVETDLGIIFLGSDLHVRLLPRGGGQSQVIAPTIREELQQAFTTPAAVGLNHSWAIFDQIKRLYYLYVDRSLNNVDRGFVVNVDTGEWGRIHFEPAFPVIGTSFIAPADSTWLSNMFAGGSTGTVFSHNSTLAQDSPSASGATAVWESPVIANDLPSNYKQITQLDFDYRSSSSGTVNVRISQNGGRTYFTARDVALPTAHRAARATDQHYVGGALPMIRFDSSSTGIELHRLDVTMNLGGRGA